MKAVALFSGGLDSTLAIKVILEQAVEVVALHFFSPFYTCQNKGCGITAEKIAQTLKVELVTKFLGNEYLSIVKNPKYGYGKNLNPCIDCRILMLKKCREMMQELGASFVITGEVLGQRPKSQTLMALKLIERQSTLEGLVLRPLSAKLLQPTIPEEKAWVDREKLLDFCGRTRKPQIKLAAILAIKDYLCPAGGCLLTYSEFAKKVKDLISHEELNLNNVELLRLGRHFRVSKDAKLVVGRNEKENERLLNLAKENDYLFAPLEIPGPTALGRGDFNNKMIELSCSIICRYCDIDGRGHTDIGYRRLPEKEDRRLTAKPIEDNTLLGFRI